VAIIGANGVTLLLVLKIIHVKWQVEGEARLDAREVDREQR
jgi:hypothetical protein